MSIFTCHCSILNSNLFLKHFVQLKICLLIYGIWIQTFGTIVIFYDSVGKLILIQRKKMPFFNLNDLICLCRALDKNEYNHITATYFLLAERRLKITLAEKAQADGSNKITTNNGRSSPKKPFGDVVDGPIDISSNNLLAPPPTGYYNNSKTAADGAVTTVSKYFMRLC